MYEIDEKCLLWLSDFSTNRTIRVKVDGCLSDEIIKTIGVSLGGSFTPICFVLFVKDFAYYVHYSIVKMYADDVKSNVFQLIGINALHLYLDKMAAWAKKLQITNFLSQTLT